MPQPLLAVHNLTVELELGNGLRFNAVDDLSFSLDAGKTFCLVGESGCGKSLTALSVLRLLPAVGHIVAGQVLFAGQNLVDCTEKQLMQVRGKGIGMIFQEPMTSLNPVLRVGEQVAEVLEHHLQMPHHEALKKTAELFTQVGIADAHTRLGSYPHQLSGGLRQRVMIAMALACNPQLLLADEPTTALDVTIQGQILELLNELAEARGMGVLLITHDLGVVAETADAVGVMYAGRMVEQAPAAALFDAPMHPYTQGLIRSAPTLETCGKARLETIPGNVPPPGTVQSGCIFRPRCSKAHERCKQRPPAVARPDNGNVCCWLYV